MAKEEYIAPITMSFDETRKTVEQIRRKCELLKVKEGAR